MKKLTLALLALFLLSGCFEIEQSLVIENNGSTEYKVILTMDQTLAFLTDKQEICNSHLNERLNSESLTFTSQEFRTGEDIGCVYQLKSSFQDFYELLGSGLLDEIFLRNINQSKNNNLSKQELLVIEKISDKTFKIKSLIRSDEYDLNPSQAKSNESSNPFEGLDSLFNESLKSMFIGKKFIFSLETPKIIISSSRIVNNGRKTSAQLPMSNLVKGKDIYFESTFQISESEDDPFSAFLE